MNLKRHFIVLIIVLFLFSTLIANANNEDKRELVYFNKFNLEVDGELIEEDNITYDGKSYIPLRSSLELFGLDMQWFPDTKTVEIYNLNSECNKNSELYKEYIDLQNKNKILREENTELNNLLNKAEDFTEDEEIKIDESAYGKNSIVYLNNYYKPIIKYEDLGIDKKDIFSIAFFKSEPQVSYQFVNEGVKFNKSFPFNYSESMKIVSMDNSIIDYIVKAQELPNLQKKEEAYTVLVPAMPDEEFNFPYMIRIPAKDSKKYYTKKNYLVFDMINNGWGKSLEECVEDVEETLSEKRQASIRRADELGYPVIMPIVPRIGVRLESEKFGKGSTYEHALNRMTLLIKELTTNDKNFKHNRSAFVNYDIDYEKYYDLDKQVISMIDHSLNYLNDNEFNLENRIILDGYSASGTFTDRLSMLYPEKIKIVVSGATIDDKMMPMESHKGEELNFPLGIADYEEITGNEFDIEKHNSVARLIYMGKDDTNNTAVYSDCFTHYGMEQIERLYGTAVLPRAQEVILSYGNDGAKGVLILDKGIEHSNSRYIREYVLDFIIENVNSEVPVYPKPKSTSLEATIYE